MIGRGKGEAVGTNVLGVLVGSKEGVIVGVAEVVEKSVDMGVSCVGAEVGLDKG